MSDDHPKGLRLLEGIDDEEEGILAYAIEAGTLTDEEVAPIWTRFDDAKAAGRTIRILSEVSAIPSVEGKMVIDKLKRIGTILSTVERMAIVGDQGWIDLYTRVIDPITKPKIRHFTTSERDDAIAWIRS
ncbi:MAG: STAS/SEC14 domain-containing protein [Sandaracinaceae bacterium]